MPDIAVIKRLLEARGLQGVDVRIMGQRVAAGCSHPDGTNSVVGVKAEGSDEDIAGKLGDILVEWSTAVGEG